MLRVAAESGLTPPQLFALRALDPDRPMPMRELAAQLLCDSSNVTGLVDRLETQGLVERRAAEHDRRLRMLVVTARGVTVRERLRAVMEESPSRLPRSARPISGSCATCCAGRWAKRRRPARRLRHVLRRALG